MSWWERRKKQKKSKLENLCHVCCTNQLPEEPAILRLAVEGGMAEMYVCEDCADFFDKSAEILNDKGRKKPLDLGPYQETD